MPRSMRPGWRASSTEGLGHASGGVVGQHDPARADPDALWSRGDAPITTSGAELAIPGRLGARPASGGGSPSPRPRGPGRRCSRAPGGRSRPRDGGQVEDRGEGAPARPAIVAAPGLKCAPGAPMGPHASARRNRLRPRPLARPADRPLGLRRGRARVRARARRARRRACAWSRSMWNPRQALAPGPRACSALLDVELARIDARVEHTFPPLADLDTPGPSASSHHVRDRPHPARLGRAVQPRRRGLGADRAQPRGLRRGRRGPERLVIVPEPFELDRLDRDAEPLALPGAHGTVFLAAFDFSLRKGWDLLIDAWCAAFARARRRDPGAEGVVDHPRHGRGRDPRRHRLAASSRARPRPRPRSPDIVVVDDLLGAEAMARLYAACASTSRRPAARAGAGRSWRRWPWAARPSRPRGPGPGPSSTRPWAGRSASTWSPVPAGAARRGPVLRGPRAGPSRDADDLADALRDAHRSPTRAATPRRRGRRPRRRLRPPPRRGRRPRPPGARRRCAAMSVVWRGAGPRPLARGPPARGLTWPASAAVGAEVVLEPLLWQTRARSRPEREQALAELASRPCPWRRAAGIQQVPGRILDPYAPGRVRVAVTCLPGAVPGEDWLVRLRQMDDVWVPGAAQRDAPDRRRGWSRAASRSCPSRCEIARRRGAAARPGRPARHGRAGGARLARARGPGRCCSTPGAAPSGPTTTSPCCCTRSRATASRSSWGRASIDAVRAAGHDPERMSDVVLLEESLPAAAMGSLYGAVDLIVAPTTGFGRGRDLLEAMAWGLPAIAPPSAAAVDIDARIGWPLPVDPATGPRAATTWWTPCATRTRATASSPRWALCARERVSAARRRRGGRRAVPSPAWSRSSRGRGGAPRGRPRARGPLRRRHRAPTPWRPRTATWPRPGALGRGRPEPGRGGAGRRRRRGRARDRRGAPRHPAAVRRRAPRSPSATAIRPASPARRPAAWWSALPWEFGAMPRDWRSAIHRDVDEVWACSRHLRDGYLALGARPGARARGAPRRRRAALPPGPGAAGAARRRRAATASCSSAACSGARASTCCWPPTARAFAAARRRDARASRTSARAAPTRPRTAEARVREMPADRAARASPSSPTASPTTTCPGLYAPCDCLVQPYRGEGYGLPIAEGMACGLPVIVPDRGSTRDFCDAGHGAARAVATDSCSTGRDGRRPAPGRAREVVEVVAPDLAAAMRARARARRRARRRRGGPSGAHPHRHTWDAAAAIAAGGCAPWRPGRRAGAGRMSERPHEHRRAVPRQPALHRALPGEHRGGTRPSPTR